MARVNSVAMLGFDATILLTLESDVTKGSNSTGFLGNSSGNFSGWSTRFSGVVAQPSRPQMSLMVTESDRNSETSKVTSSDSHAQCTLLKSCTISSQGARSGSSTALDTGKS